MCAYQFGINVPRFLTTLEREFSYYYNHVLTGYAPYKEVSEVQYSHIGYKKSHSVTRFEKVAHLLRMLA